MPNALEISVVIPVYNAEPTLPDLIQRLIAVMKMSGRTFELILVNDGSSDGSWGRLKGLYDEYPNHIIAINLMRNFGQHNALMCGLRASSGELIVTMDDDLQNPPEEIPKLLEAMEERDLDLVYGVYSEKQHEDWRNLGSTLVQIFYRAVFGLSNSLTSFRIVRRQLVESVLTYSLNYTFLDGLFAWNTNRIGTVLVDHEERSAGRSGYSLGRLVLLALNLFSNFSLIPLQLISLVGIFVAVGGFGVSGYYLFQYFANAVAVPGFVSTIIAILVLGGIQLVALGVMGEYLGRLHLNMNRKPQYVEREVLKR